MKICFIAPDAYQLFNPSVKTVFGGAEVQLHLLAKSMDQFPHVETHFMVADFGQEKVEQYDNIKVWRTLNFQKNIISQIFQFFKVFVKINADVYVQMALTPFSALMALYCRLIGKKFIYLVAHDTETDGTHEIFTNKFKKWVSELCFKVSHVLISQNIYQKNNIKQRKGRDSMILRSGVMVPAFKEKIDLNSFHLWVARAESWKQPLLFIELAAAFPKEKFVMICPQNGDKEEEIAFYQQVKGAAEQVDNLKLIGLVPITELDSYFEKAKTFVNTSESEGFPTTFIHAAQHAVPILSLQVNPDNLIKTYDCGFVCEGDFEQFKAEFAAMINDHEHYLQMRKGAYRYAKGEHDVEKNSERFMQLIQANH